MTGSQLRDIAQSLRRSKDPVGQGRGLLLEEYRKAGNAEGGPEAAMAGYELAKSMVLQASYEEFGAEGGYWLSAGDIGAERADAEEELWAYRHDGMEYALRRADSSYMDDPKNHERIMLDMESSGITRFIGSVRASVPGLGYAVSVRKRDTMNQDSFIMDAGLMAVADGCSGSRFPAIASHEALRRAGRMRAGLLTDPKGTICAISAHIAGMLSDDAMSKALGAADGGCTTLTIGLLGPGRLYKVGDSLPFLGRSGSAGVADISPRHELLAVVGHALSPEGIEELDAGGGQLILTTDGVTNYVPDFVERLGRLLEITTDPVMIAENIMRAVLRNRMAWGHADDATIIVQDDGMIR